MEVGIGTTYKTSKNRSSKGFMGIVSQDDRTVVKLFLEVTSVAISGFFAHFQTFLAVSGISRSARVGIPEYLAMRASSKGW